ncbi:MAG TPA: hypothetical protein VFP56_12950 [Candidatus Limnocylindrales bacterium]|nr:hypothetical protein [Candidatus Limnocylindrales bacterium]
MRHRRAGLIALALLLSTATPTLAGTETFEEPIFSVFPDTSNHLVGFWNITRDAYCAWEAEGFAGPAPVTELVTGQFRVVSRGPVIARYAVTRNLELWPLDQDATLSGPCADTDESAVPFAIGTAHVAATDNDVFRSEDSGGAIRTHSFGESGEASVVDEAGNRHRYQWGFRALEYADGSFRSVERSTLTP